MNFNLSSSVRRTQWLVLGLSLAMVAWSAAASTPDEQMFNSPDEAVAALVAAAKNDDTNAMHVIFGPEIYGIMSTDAVQAAAERQRFEQRLSEKTFWVSNSDTIAVLELGADRWPFPIPLINQDGKWFFDTAAGKSEILNRRIGMNELGAIDVCNAYVEAQREYASTDRFGDGVLAYALYLKSTPGLHDGLYWPTNQGAELSPLGPLIAQARVEGYHRTAHMLSDAQAPYHGYYFKILTRQGKHAPGGAYNYIINGRLIAGFALVAWPAEWQNTGVMTFIVNQQGQVYQKNLGPKTLKLAEDLTTYDPDDSWTTAE